MQTTQARSAALAHPVAPRAIAAIDACRASVAGMTGDGLTWTCEIDRGWLPEPAFLAEVARVIGERRHVVILGPDAISSELERRYAAMYPEAECLVDAEPTGAVTVAELVHRLRARSENPLRERPTRRRATR